MLDMEALERALAPVEDVGREEITFEVEGHTITLRPILPGDEVTVQKQAQTALADQKDSDGTDRYAALDYFNRFRIETLAFALAQVDDLDLRDVEYVGTTEKTQSGKRVRFTRNAAVRKLLNRWSRPMIRTAYDQYTDLLTRIEQRAEKLVEYTPADLKAELERAEKRVSDLKVELVERAQGDPNLTAEQMKAIHDGANAASKPALTAESPRHGEVPPPHAPHQQEPAAGALPESPETTTAAAEEEWATFDDVPTEADLRGTPLEPPPEPPPAAPPTPPPPTSATPPRRPVTPPSSPPPGELAGTEPNTVPDPLSDVMDSFADVDDEAALMAEQERILAARKKLQREQQGDASPQGRVPPHMRGAFPDGDALSVGVSGGAIRQATPEELAARGVPQHLTTPPQDAAVQATSPQEPGAVVRPTETLSPRGRGRGQKTEPVQVNPRERGRGTSNTNFRRPQE